MTAWYSKKAISKKLRILNLPPKYTVRDAWYDFLAGILTGIPALPQGIIYAEIANVPIMVSS
jgi:MFS superfamily sulfate permease-like transporter